MSGVYILLGCLIGWGLFSLCAWISENWQDWRKQ